MPLVEVDDRELSDYKRLTAFLQSATTNSKTRRKLLEIQKELNPNQAIPELDAAAPLNDELAQVKSSLAAMSKLMADDKAAREQEKQLAQLSRQWEKGRTLLRKQGYVEEGIDAVEKFMEQRGIADHEVGMAAFERLQPPETPVAPVSGNRFDVFAPRVGDDAHMKALFANPNDRGALNGLIADSLRAVRGR
jgi:hypothetical protein